MKSSALLSSSWYLLLLSLFFCWSVRRCWLMMSGSLSQCPLVTFLQIPARTWTRTSTWTGTGTGTGTWTHYALLWYVLRKVQLPASTRPLCTAFPHKSFFPWDMYETLSNASNRGICKVSGTQYLSPARLKSFCERGNARPAALIMKAG